jgi:hypothetical protein
MKELNLLVENYFSPALGATDILRLVEQVMNEVSQPKELGKPFEYVVVQVAREFAAANPLDGGDYEKAKVGGLKNAKGQVIADWRNARFGGKKGKTLEQLAVELYDMASKATDSRGVPIFSQEDFQTAKVTDIGKQKYGGGSTKVEIKSDIQFGDKTISLKLPGDVQAGSSEGVTQAEQLSIVLDYHINNAKNKVAEYEAERLKALLETSKTAILKLAEKSFLGSGRQRMFSDEIAALKAGEKPSALVQAYIKEGIMDATATYLDDRYYFDADAASEKIGAKVNEIFQSNDKLWRKLVHELLSGAIGFAEIPGAEAQFILNPEHLFDLSDDKTIDIYADAIELRVALKGGRAIGIKSIDDIRKPQKPDGKKGKKYKSAASPSYRWDIKANLLERAIAKEKAKADALIRQLAALTFAATKPGSPIQMREEESQEQSLDLGNMFDRAYDDIMIGIVNNFEEELKDSPIEQS